MDYLRALDKRLFSNSDPEQELIKIKWLQVRKASARAKILRIAKDPYISTPRHILPRWHPLRYNER